MNLARKGADVQAIREAVQDMFEYRMDRSVDVCREEHFYNETCQHCVPDAIICALEVSCFEDAIRNTVSLGGVMQILWLPLQEVLRKFFFGFLSTLSITAPRIFQTT